MFRPGGKHVPALLEQDDGREALAGAASYAGCVNFRPAASAHLPSAQRYVQAQAFFLPPEHDDGRAAPLAVPVRATAGMAAGASRVEWTKAKQQMPDGTSRDILIKSAFEDASEVAAALKVPAADVKHGFKVQKITDIYYPDEGRTEPKQLWVMDSFAHALSSKWGRKDSANKAAAKIKDFDSLTKIEIKLPEVTYFYFVL